MPSRPVARPVRLAPSVARAFPQPADWRAGGDRRRILPRDRAGLPPRPRGSQGAGGRRVLDVGDGVRDRVLRRRRPPPPLTRSAARLGVDRRRLRPVPGGPARLELLRADPPRDAALPLARGRGLPGRLRLLPRDCDEAGRGRTAPMPASPPTGAATRAALARVQPPPPR